MKSPTEFEAEQFASTDFEVYTSPDFENRTSSEMEDGLHSYEDDPYNDQLVMKKPEEERYFIPARESLMGKEQPVGYSTKTKQEAKQVCGKISRLLRDKKSRTRGSCMFRKRKKRSEKFTIVGYGTQPVDHHPDTDLSSQEESESSPFTSSDDEIPIYDHPGPNNLLEQDVLLTSSEKVLHHQLKNLAMDAVQMKGKGAKMFAKRKNRMEKFVIENNPSLDKNQYSNHQNEVRNHVENDVGINYYEEHQDSDIRSSHTPVSFHNIHATKPSEGTVSLSRFQIEDGSGSEVEEIDNNRYYNVGSNMYNPHSHNKLEDSIQAGEKIPWTEQDMYSNVDWSTDDEVIVPMQEKRSLAYNQCCLKSKNNEKKFVLQDSSQRMRFRSVKPPTPNVAPPQLPETGDSVTGLSNVENNDSLKPSLTKNVNSSGKSWAPVQFQPKQIADQCSTARTEKVAYPFPVTSNSSQGSIKLTPVWAPKSVHATASSTKSLPFIKPTNIVAQKQTVSMLQEPNLSSAPLSCLLNDENKDECEKLGFSSAKGSQETAKINLKDKSTNREDASSSVQDQQTDSLQTNLHITTSQIDLNNSTTHTKAYTSPTLNAHAPMQDSEAICHGPNDELEKPKVAACLKLLDPSKGKYEPKMAVVYKKTNSIGAKLDEDERPLSRNKSCEPPYFNKPVKLTPEFPKTSYMKHFQGAASQTKKESQPLGSIAGELKGKGAKMFEKQQKRMENYTKECNGEKQNTEPPIGCCSSGQVQKIPEKKTKENMSHVLGEFRKVSDSDSPKLPSATRKHKGKDPCPYQNYYVSRRLPSAADFVCIDESADLVSDSNNSTTSSMTSYDRMSRTSSEKRLDEAERDNNVFEDTELVPPKVPPKIAPKPKLVKKISSESNSSSVTSITGNNGMQKISSDMGKTPAGGTNILFEVNSGVNPKNKNPVLFPSHTWSPDQPRCNHLSFDHLPPPPSYVEVSKQPTQVPKPTFRASGSGYEPYNPVNATASNDLTTNEEISVSPVHLSYEPEIKQTFNCPKPNFTARAPVSKWKPSGDE